MNDLSTLFTTLDTVWHRLHCGVTDRTAPAHQPVLATVGAEGAEARVVILRHADRAAGVIEVQSDLRAPKVAELIAEPHATLLIWDALTLLQIRLRARFEVISGAAAEDRWQVLSPSARTLYGGLPAPGAPIPYPSAHGTGPDRAVFAVLRGHLTAIETLHLRPDHHRRALFTAAGDWQGSWRAP